ncbi:unnamed protein product [Adineta ricciae]|uniref:Uncharacterized protein n=1 Tax=Adineta ricciae TaxID=249248 RepID=A0A814QMU1_ADIRI|nr:unnamed protein product [Adineta ricciae]CAF1523068.1 unnamed protein product [Adineta ricciae]
MVNNVLILFLICALAMLLSVYAQNGTTIFCQHNGPIFSCPQVTCTPVGVARRGFTYPSQCYVIRIPNPNIPGESPQWFRLNVTSNKTGYVNEFFCAGDVPRCRRNQDPN